MVRNTLSISERVFLHQKHVSSVSGAIYSRERSVCFMWNKIKGKTEIKFCFLLNL